MRRSDAAASRVRVALAAVLVLVAAGCAPRRATFVAPSRPAQFSLAGIPWGIAADSVTSLVGPRGYNYNSVDGDGDLWYDGLLYRAPTRIYAFMGNERLVKFRVLIVTPDENALSVYERARAELLKQYGTPAETVEEYRAPYRKGDGKEQAAVRAGKATFRTDWLLENARTPHVAVEVTKDLNVVIDYESAAWNGEMLRRRKR